MVNRVWISGDQVRWEMEAEVDVPDHVPARLPWNYTVVFTSEKSICLRAPNESKKESMSRVRDTRSFRQGMSWNTAMHAIAKNGIPDNCRVVEETKTGDNRMVVLEMNLDNAVASAGLGMYGLMLGEGGCQIDRVRLHVRLPDYVPIREEYFDAESDVPGNTTIEFGPEYIRVGEHLAPTKLRYVEIADEADHEPPSPRQWVMEGHFHEVQGVWLLNKAFNIHDGKVVRRIQVSDVSTAPIPAERFAVPDEEELSASENDAYEWQNGTAQTRGALARSSSGPSRRATRFTRDRQ